MDAVVYLAGDGQYYVSLRLLGKEVDLAGPFDDDADAVLAAERNVSDDGEVIVAEAVRAPGHLKAWNQSDREFTPHAAGGQS